MRPSILAACLALALLLAGGCAAKKETVVLLPDLDGKVGRVEVQSAKGAQELARESQAVEVSARTQAPGQPFVMPPERIRELFGPALDAQPTPPARYLLYFTTGAAQLTPESQALLPAIAATIRDRQSTDTSIVGHADRTGTQPLNLRLSRERAEAVAGLLTAQGIDPAIFQITSHGSANPLIPTAEGVAEPRNRRVEVVVR